MTKYDPFIGLGVLFAIIIIGAAFLVWTEEKNK